MGPKWHFFSIWLGWRWGKTNDRHRASTLATVVIAAGMAVLMIGLSTGKGLQEAIHQRITALQGDAQIRSYHQPNAFESMAFNWTASKPSLLTSNLLPCPGSKASSPSKAACKVLSALATVNGLCGLIRD
jgi:ABC-type lipoprotein release transport system permease subunit